MVKQAPVARHCTESVIYILPGPRRIDELSSEACACRNPAQRIAFEVNLPHFEFISETLRGWRANISRRKNRNFGRYDRMTGFGSVRMELLIGSSGKPPGACPDFGGPLLVFALLLSCFLLMNVEPTFRRPAKQPQDLELKVRDLQACRE